MNLTGVERKMRLLGICASPREDGNSQYLLDAGLREAEERHGDFVEVRQYHFHGKKFSPCISCFKCSQPGTLGECVIRDDFQELRDSWLEADCVIYSVPVYHFGIPGQLKCFLDRLGNTLNKRFSVSSPRFLKVIGSIAQGTHFAAGQEAAVNYLVQHALLKNCIPVAGDGWQSYIGACGWTASNTDKRAMMTLFEHGDTDAALSVAASKTLCRRAIELALIVHSGAQNLREYFLNDEAYDAFTAYLPAGRPPCTKPIER